MDEPLATWLRSVLGDVEVEQDTSWDHGESLVLRLRDAAGTRWYAKQHRRAEFHERELTAYQRWTPALGPSAPTLLAFDDELRVLVLSAVPGEPADEVSEPVHQQAGKLMRKLHEAATPEPWPDHVADKLERLDRWTARGAGIVSADDVDFARSELRSLESLPTPPRVPCHLDYSPRNWLVVDGRVSVIDFNVSGLEVWVNDLARVYFGIWRDRPGLRDAFLDGYGRQPTDDELAMLVACYAFSAVWMIVWAREHGSTSFEAALRDILADLKRRRWP